MVKQETVIGKVVLPDRPTSIHVDRVDNRIVRFEFNRDEPDWASIGDFDRKLHAFCDKRHPEPVACGGCGAPRFIGDTCQRCADVDLRE